MRRIITTVFVQTKCLVKQRCPIQIQVFPAFQKFAFFYFAFTKDLQQYYLFPVTERDPKRIYFFKKKGEKQESIKNLFVERQWAP